MHYLLRILLLPFSIIYGLGVSLHQGFYASGVLKPVRFNFPVICIGNLSIGGSGKTPHVEYLIRLLKDYLYLAVLSRGYKRKTSGFLLVNEAHSALEVGDEPKQMHSHFPEVPFAVSESRAMGIPRLLREFPELQLILLDDAYQHLAVQAGLNILLTEFAKPYTRDFLLPAGRLREWAYGASRAHAIVVTKCPDNLHSSDFDRLRNELKPGKNQELFFSWIEYGHPYNIFNPSQVYKINPSMHVTLISAIAQSSYLEEYLIDRVASLRSFHFEDHHFFSESELTGLFENFSSVVQSNKMLLTTEKDATRLMLFKEYFERKNIEVYAIPIQIRFYDHPRFDQWIRDYLLSFKVK